MKKVSREVKILGFVVVAVLVLVLFSLRPSPKGEYDNFANCITNSGAKMFGAYWCSNCNNQKDLFGSSFDNIQYIECSLPNKGGQTPECNQEGITGYPTWEFADGERVAGFTSLVQLSLKTGCPLVKDSN